ncbi:MAG: hypothetical protein J6W79_03675 [Alphaproteobacteria bacterium]|nr:hypothetical protein [Alphaproteobacteria bacterium]
MSNKLLDFYKSHKYVILWTVGYFIATWTIMNFMFDFNILSTHRWWQLGHAHIHGFPGLVFGILLLAAVPMYIATTIVIAKTKEPLFTVKIPEFIKRAFQQTPMEEPTPEPATEPVATPVSEEPETKPDTPAPIPETVPSELRVAYARAREHIERTTSAFDLANVTQTSAPKSTDIESNTSTPGEIPIPTDFDIDDDLDDMMNSVPQFKEINFDDDDAAIIDDDDIDNQLAEVKSVSNTATPVEQYLTSKSIAHTIDNDVVLTNKYAIVSHTDNEFWIADNESWFAAGKTRPSPIELVKKSATEHNVQPILFLGANNIMDIDNLIPQWENDGIKVITDLKDLI